MKRERKKSEDMFLTVDQAFDNAIDSIKDKLGDIEKGKIYVWKQRFKEGNLSHKKIATILEDAGFHKVVEERWMPLDPKVMRRQEEITAALYEEIEEAFPR
jgi:hypothetical protein